MKKLYTAAVTAAMLAAPALAADQADPFPDREAVSAIVSTRGLDLDSARDRKTLERRIARAVAAACDSRDVYAVYSGPDTQCHQEIAQSITAKMQTFAQNARVPTDGSAVGKN